MCKNIRLFALHLILFEIILRRKQKNGTSLNSRAATCLQCQSSVRLFILFQFDIFWKFVLIAISTPKDLVVSLYTMLRSFLCTCFGARCLPSLRSNIICLLYNVFLERSYDMIGKNILNISSTSDNFISHFVSSDLDKYVRVFANFSPSYVSAFSNYFEFHYITFRALRSKKLYS